jgi:hypothetical protein
MPRSGARSAFGFSEATNLSRPVKNVSHPAVGPSPASSSFRTSNSGFGVQQ